MTRRLILNADDFGLTPGVNRAIIDLHRAGALSSATLMATGPAADDALALAREHRGLGVGCHVVLTDGTPAADPGQVSSLLDPDGRSFRSRLAGFMAAALLGRLNPRELELEIETQVRRLQAAGLPVTHLDTHKHTHLVPQVLGPLLRVAQRLGIRAVRNPFEPVWASALRHGSPGRRLQLRLLSKLRRSFNRQVAATAGRVVTTEGTLGISTTGELGSGSLAELLDCLPPGTWELVCHPGVNDADLARIATRLRGHREIEREALAAVVPAWLQQHATDVQLIHFGDLASATEHRVAAAFASEAS